MSSLSGISQLRGYVTINSDYLRSTCSTIGYRCYYVDYYTCYYVDYYTRGGTLGKSQNMHLFASKVQLLTRHFIELDPT
jgi:hypothetical protein